jgi:hydroxypyruvate reductase
MSVTTVAPRAALLGIFDAAVASAQARSCLPPHLPEPPRGRLVLLGTGKAGAAMVAAAEAHYLDHLRVPASRVAGLATCRRGYAVDTRLVPVIEAGHPIPDAAGMAATKRTIELAHAAGPDDLVLVLLSGGGSANWVAPAGRLTLDEKRVMTKALQRAGATIHEVNCVRKHLSRIKGGRLARIAAPARVVALAISDVPGDDPSVIASGPTVADPSTLADAQAVFARYGVEAPASARALLEDPRSETPKPGDPAFAATSYAIVCRPADALAAAAERARAYGYEPVLLGAEVVGEARRVGAEHAAIALAKKREGRRVAVISGGELTVTVRGTGRGGPNQEYALGLALGLGGASGIHALAADTDGTDGGAGSAADPAGALVDPTTLARASSLGLDPRASLDHNDATGFFEVLRDLVDSGPTKTNVNDLRVILIEGT